MRLDRRLGDAELVGDLLVEQTLRQHHQHANLLRRQRGEPTRQRARFAVGLAQSGSKSGGVHRPPSSTCAIAGASSRAGSISE